MSKEVWKIYQKIYKNTRKTFDKLFVLGYNIIVTIGNKRIVSIIICENDR